MLRNRKILKIIKDITGRKSICIRKSINYILKRAKK